MVEEEASDKIRILFLTTTTKVSGAEKQLIYLINGLNNRYIPAVCSIMHGGDMFSRLGDIRKYSLGITKKTQLIKALKLHSIIKDFQPDIIQSFLDFDNILAATLGSWNNVKIITGKRDSVLKRSFFRKILLKMAYGSSDCIIANSNAGRGYLLRNKYAKENRINVIHNAIDLEYYQENVKYITLKGKKNIGCISNFTHAKNIKTLLKAVASIKEKPTLYILGSGNTKGIKTLARQMGVNLVLPGYIKDVRPYLKSFDVFVLPSIYEGFPNTVMEAMAARCPVVVSGTGGISELIARGEGLIVNDPLNTAEFTRCIGEIINHPRLAQKLSRRAADKIKKFGLNEMIFRHDKIYRRLI